MRNPTVNAVMGVAHYIMDKACAVTNATHSLEFV